MNKLLARALHKMLVLKRAIQGHQEDRAALGQQAHRFWNDLSRPQLAHEAHWRGHGPFADDALWLKLGQGHKALLHRVLAATGQTVQHQQVVEWGCGGGMNAVHFARGAHTYWGVDIAQTSLDECARQMQQAGLPGFKPVLVDVNDPRAALRHITTPCDLFVCTYVMELMPTESHALEVLGLAYELLAPGAHALVQIRTTDGALASRSRPWDYGMNVAHNVRFRVADFSAACEALGFRVLGVESQATVPELQESDYAFFVLQR
jgi:predicted TPR repeat methyltransferase